jgi:hypothetical protein
MQQRDRRGAVGPFFEGEGAEVAVHWPPPPQAPTPLWTMPSPPRLSTRVSRAKRSCQPSIWYRRRRLWGCKTRGGEFTHGLAEVSRHEGCGGEGLGGGRGQGLGARAAVSARAGPAGPRCAGMREGREARAGQRPAGMHEGGLRP